MKIVLSNEWHEVVRFDRDEEVVEGVKKLAAEKKIEAAWLAAIGSAKEIELGFYDLEKQEYLNKTWREALEVLEASGTLARQSGGQDPVVLHMHGVFGDKNYQTIGGHVHRLVANATVEVFIHKMTGRLERQRDEKTGLNLLA